MKQPNCVRVAVLDDDDLARLGGVSLLSRDLRTSVVFDCSSPEELLTWLAEVDKPPEVILLDMEYRSDSLPLQELLSHLNEVAPCSKIVGLSQFGEPETLQIAIKHRLNGLLLKKEVSLSLATAVVNAAESDFVCTHAIKSGLLKLGHAVDDESSVQESWQLHPELTPRLREVFWLCLVYGMSARMAANEMFVADNSVERYRNRIYQILNDDWYYDGSSLAPWKHLLHDHQPDCPKKRKQGFWGQEWAFQVMTMPPRAQTRPSQTC